MSHTVFWLKVKCHIMIDVEHASNHVMPKG